MFPGKSGQLPENVAISGCDKPPCQLIKGIDVIVKVQFIASKSSSTLTPRVSTKVIGLSIPYGLPHEQQNGCDHLTDTRCPLDANEYATYILTMPILRIYPSIGIEIQLELLNDQKESMFCFSVDCKVVDD